MQKEHEISQLICAIEELCGVRICFYDTKNFFHYSERGERAYTGHYCDFCRYTRELPGGRLACDKSDRHETAALAAAHRAPFFKRCHMGLCELVVPVLQKEQLCGLVFVGGCRIAGEDPAAEIAARAAALTGDSEAFLSLYAAMPQIKREHLMAIGRVFALYFARGGEGEGFFAPVPEEGGLSVVERACRYIEANYYRELSLASVSARFYLGPAYFARLFARKTGQSVGDYIRATRHAHACRLLAHSGLPIGHVALNVGYTDPSYFARIFKKLCGLTPQAYRAQMQKG